MSINRGSKDNDDVLLVTGVGVLMSSVAPPPSPTSPCYGREVVVKRRERERHGITIAAAEGEGSEAAEAVVHNEEEEEEREEEIKALYENADVVIRGMDWKYRIEGGCCVAKGTYNGEVVQYVLPGVNWNIIGTLRGDKTLLVKVGGWGER